MTDYLYGSARVRALETRLCGRERIAALPDEESASDVWARLTEYGIVPIRGDDGRIDREATLLSILRGAYANVREMLPEDETLSLWLYPYDCNNVKAAIKGFVRGIDPRSMMFDFGTQEVERVIDMARLGNFEGLPPHMAAAATEACEAYAKTKDPRVIDLYLDKACYADMLASASGVGFCAELVRLRIDLVNCLSLVRVLRMKSGEAGEALLLDAWLAGGNLDTAFLRDFYRAGEEALWSRLKLSDFGAFAHRLGAASSLTAIEREADDFWMERLKTVKFMPYGAEVITAYLLAVECEVRNLRIILAGKEAGIPAATIRERIREGYV